MRTGAHPANCFHSGGASFRNHDGKDAGASIPCKTPGKASSYSRKAAGYPRGRAKLFAKAQTGGGRSGKGRSQPAGQFRDSLTLPRRTAVVNSYERSILRGALPRASEAADEASRGRRQRAFCTQTYASAEFSANAPRVRREDAGGFPATVAAHVFTTGSRKIAARDSRGRSGGGGVALPGSAGLHRGSGARRRSCPRPAHRRDHLF